MIGQVVACLFNPPVDPTIKTAFCSTLKGCVGFVTSDIACHLKWEDIYPEVYLSGEIY
jgi:hypothetical protein